MSDIVLSNASPTSIFDVPADIARAYYERAYVPAQIEQHLAYRKIRDRIYRPYQLRLPPKQQAVERPSPSEGQGLNREHYQPQIVKIGLSTWGVTEERGPYQGRKARQRRERLYKILASFESREGTPIERPAIRSHAWRIVTRFEGERIAADVAGAYGMTLSQLRSRARFLEFVVARHEVMYRLRRELLMSLPDIARVLRLDDHTTVRSGLKSHARRLAALKAKIEAQA